MNGSLFKIGKADLSRVTAGNPNRLNVQLRKLRSLFGKDNVDGSVVNDLGKVTTAQAKVAENARISQRFRETGFVPLGNWKSFKS